MKAREVRRRKRRRRKILFLFIWTLFLFLLLTSSTYAWFTVNRVVSIEALNIKVNVKGGLEISTDAIEWKTVLTSEDIINAHATYPNSVNMLPDALEPVSTAGTVNSNHFLNMYYGIAQTIGANEYYTLNSTLSPEVEGTGEDIGKYMAFDVFLRFNSEAPLFLISGSGTSIPEGIEDVGIGNAVRTAIVNQGYGMLDAAPALLQNMKNATSSDVYIWEPNYDIHTQNGVNHAQSLYNISTTITGGERIPYDGVDGEFTYGENISLNRATSTYYPQFFKPVNIPIATVNDFKQSVTVIPSCERGIHKLRIYIWIEGQDVDCEDHAAVGDVLFNIQFSTLNEE